jgi:diaminopimelate epimerase
MAREIHYTVGRESGTTFAVLLDADGENDLSAADYRLLANAADAGPTCVIRVVRSIAIAEGRETLAHDPDAEWFMDFRNADGLPGVVGGDGVMVVVAFLIDQQLVTTRHGDRLVIGARDGVKDVQVGSNGTFRVDLGRWASGGFTNTLAVPMVNNAELDEMEFSTDPQLDSTSTGFDTVFIAPQDPIVDDGIGRIRVRVVKHGLGEIPSSGTAAVAAALETRRGLGAEAPHNWRVDSNGGSLGVQFFPTEEGEHVSISGAAEIVRLSTVVL